MVAITDDPDPTFSSLFEPSALAQQRCGVCAVAMAVLQCSACALQFCVACERDAHDAARHQPDAVRRELEVTKSAEDALLVHQEHVTAVNLCQVCTLKTVDFLCVDCRSYQCEECCAGRHLHTADLSTHFFFCVEGSSPGLLRYAQWSPEFVELAKMSHRVMLQSREDERAAAAQVKQETVELAAAVAAAATATEVAPPVLLHSTPVSILVPPMSSADDIARVKVERAHDAPPAEPIHDMEALSIAEAPAGVKPEPSIANQLPPAPPLPVAEAPVQQQQQEPSPPLLPELEPTIQQHQQPLLPGVEPTTQPLVKPDPTAASPGPSQTPQPAAEHPTSPELTNEPPSSSIKPEAPAPPSTPTPAVPTGGGSSSAVVDLTEDDDETEGATPFASSSFGTLGRMEHPVKRESSAWLQAAASSLAATAGGSAVDDNDDLSDTFDDPIKRTMVGEYNRLSEVIFNHEQEMASIQTLIKDLLATQSANMNEVVKLSNVAAQVKTSIVAETQNRNAAVARLVVYLKQDHAELDALLGESSVDIPHIQAASHRRCAQLEAIIRDKRFEIRQLKRSMEEAISMKASTPFEEVSRLGALVVAAEQAVRESEEARVVEFIRLVQFSDGIRAVARALTIS